jgi:hypothetical protein
VSIIYNALKKTQGQRSAEQQKIILPVAKRSFLTPWHWIMFLLMLSLATALYVSHKMPAGHFKNFYLSFLHTKKQPAPSPVALAPLPPMELDGVFISDSSRVAMINQQLYSLGSKINNMKIVEISPDRVLLVGANNRREILQLAT